MAGLETQDLRVPKTIKLFIGGEFPRTESGRTYPVFVKSSKSPYANLCLASRKDFRAAVTAAKDALPGWESRTAYNRGQILYRAAEILESRREGFSELLVKVLGLAAAKSKGEIDLAIDSLIYFAGAADKFQQIAASVNPVSGPHHNFTTPEPVGVVAGLFSESSGLGKVFGTCASVIASGNTLVALLPGPLGVLVAEMGEVFATSDLPKGALNLLSGDSEELLEQFGGHMEIQSLFASKLSTEARTKLKTLSVENMKRYVELSDSEFSVENLLDFVEYKTVWHPVDY